MNVFKIYTGYRDIGVNTGLPVWYVDFGPGYSAAVEQIIDKLGSLEIQQKRWVVLRGGPLKEKGIGVLVQGLKYLMLKVELEDSGSNKAPIGVFTEVDRYIIDWVKEGEFNYNALRARQDILIYRGTQEGIEDFLTSTKDCNSLKAVWGNREEWWDLAKKYDLRVYEEEEKE